MARWRRRSKAGPSGAQKPGASKAPTGLNGVEELRGELESLKAELSSAQAEASSREQAAHRSRRGIAVAAGVVTVGAGVTAGLLAADQGSPTRLAAPVTAPNSASPALGTPPPASQPAVPPTQPPTSQPPTAQPPSSAAPPTPPGGGLIVVERGDSFWSIARVSETQILGRLPGSGELTSYWLALIAANSSRLAHPGDPNLLYVGQVIRLPPI